jgi:hypothetical protein
MSKRLLVTLAAAVALLATSGAVFAQPQTTLDNITEALKRYARQGGDLGLPDEGPLSKAVPRTDKAEAVVTGVLFFVSDVDFLDDGTPLRFVAIESRRPFAQDLLIACLGSSSVNACGRLVEGRRVQITSDLIALEDEDAGLYLLIAKKIQT